MTEPTEERDGVEAYVRMTGAEMHALVTRPTMADYIVGVRDLGREAAAALGEAQVLADEQVACRICLGEGCSDCAGTCPVCGAEDDGTSARCECGEVLAEGSSRDA